ncbi:hypothetical protein MNBD_BACTEROID03-263 [hydrothermal vent metagenome]|uniref:Uncharacterized protein n=1 Tax=hydrothermal vent metagenome TaxID=652676 RepID=A0A3B0T2W9_9ZZZZ
MITFNGTHQGDWTNYFNETAFDLLDLHAYPDGRAGFWRPEAVLDLFQDNRTRNDYPIMGAVRTYQADDWINLVNGDVVAQAGLFIERDITNIGFYGWYLQASNGYYGLNTHANLYEELEEVIRTIDAAIIRADVDQQDGITTTDAMLTLRNSARLDMSETNWQASSTTRDANCGGDSSTL